MLSGGKLPVRAGSSCQHQCRTYKQNDAQSQSGLLSKGIPARAQESNDFCGLQDLLMSLCIVAGARPTTLGPQDPNNLAAQLQALSLLSNFQEGKREVLQSENSQHGPKWNVAGQGNGSSSPTKPQPLPHGWMQITDPEKRVLYHNYLTGHTQYTLPTVGQPGVEAPSGSSTDMDKTAAFPGLGQRMSGPASVGHSLHGDSTAAMLSQRMSGPASIGQRLPGSDSRAMATEAQPTGLDAASSGLTQRMQEQEFKIGAVL